MIIIPAIDITEGKCVRLLQGRFDAATVYSEDPAATGRKWASLGAELIHIVDLDGAFSGSQLNLESIRAIRQAVDVPLEVGGGIRSIADIERLIGMGIDRVIMGTAAALDPALLARACDKYPGSVLAGIDAREGKVAVKGWVQDTGVDAIVLARKMQEAGAAGIIYTDISRDGMLSGPNIEATSRMNEAVSVPVIASGGISKIEDIKHLLSIKGLWGAITGKAIYSGKIDLKEAIDLTRRPRC